MIDRHLLADEARRRKLDATPDFVSDRERLDQTLLARYALEDAARASTGAAQAQQPAFILDNPALFARREQLIVHAFQVRPATADQRRSILAARSLDELRRLLAQAGIASAEEQRTIDAAALPPRLAAQIVALPPGALFALPAASGLTVGGIVARRPVAMSDVEQLALADRIMKRDASRQAAQGLLTDLRKAAHVTYQNGYAPPAAARATIHDPAPDGRGPAAGGPSR